MISIPHRCSCSRTSARLAILANSLSTLNAGLFQSRQCKHQGRLDNSSHVSRCQCCPDGSRVFGRMASAGDVACTVLSPSSCKCVCRICCRCMRTGRSAQLPTMARLNLRARQRNGDRRGHACQSDLRRANGAASRSSSLSSPRQASSNISAQLGIHSPPVSSKACSSQQTNASAGAAKVLAKRRLKHHLTYITTSDTQSAATRMHL